MTLRVAVFNGRGRCATVPLGMRVILVSQGCHARDPQLQVL